MAVRINLPATLSGHKVDQLQTGFDFFNDGYGHSTQPPGVPDPDYEQGMKQAREDWLEFGAQMFDRFTGESANSSWWAWKQWGKPGKQ